MFTYNYKTGECKALPSMIYKRSESAAVIYGNAIVLMGGYEVQGRLRSVECFTFDRYCWEELTPMNEPRNKPIAVIIPVNVVQV